MNGLWVKPARHADRSRFELSFISLGDRGRVAEEIEGLGWPVVAMGEPAGLRPSIIFKLATLFRRWRVDVVHSHNPPPLMDGGAAGGLAGGARPPGTRPPAASLPPPSPRAPCWGRCSACRWGELAE